MDVIKVQPAYKFSGAVSVPGDKSISHRAAILGSLCDGIVEVFGFLCSKDCLATLDAIRAMGVKVDGFGSPNLVIHGVGLYGLKQPEKTLDLGNSGTGLRLLSGVVSGYPFDSVLTGDESLRKRPMTRIVSPLKEMGAKIEGGKCPLKIKGGNLNGIFYKSKIASAQVKSSILLAGLFAKGVTKVTEPFKSRDHTERMLEYLCADISVNELEVKIVGGTKLKAKPIVVPGDISSAAFFVVAALAIKGAKVKITGIEINPTRSLYLDILKQMGADIVYSGTEIIVKYSQLKGVNITKQQIPGIIDELPILAVAASVAKGKTEISGAEELRVKECDRIAAITTNLKKLGVNIIEKKDGWTIIGGNTMSGVKLESYRDHRIAMAMVIAGLLARGETVVQDTSWIDTSFPGFMDKIDKLRY